MPTPRALLPPLVLLSLAACNEPGVARRLSELEVRTKALEAAAARDEKASKAGEERLGRVEKLAFGDNQRLDLLTDELARPHSPASGDEATISCAGEGYAFVPTAVGPIVVGCADLAPYGDGYRITLLVGNPHLVTISGFSLKVRYGPRDAGPDRSGAARETAVRFPDKLRPGTWSRVRVTLAPCRAEDTGFLAVTVSAEQLVLDGRAIGR